MIRSKSLLALAVATTVSGDPITQIRQPLPRFAAEEAQAHGLHGCPISADPDGASRRLLAEPHLKGEPVALAALHHRLELDVARDAPRLDHHIIAIAIADTVQQFVTLRPDLVE